jgi:hypothetical protein
MTKKKSSKKSSVLVGDLSIDQILDQVDFEDEEVEHAARTLPKCFFEAARYRVRILRKRQMLEQKLDASRVDAAIATRHRASTGGTKITEAGIKEVVEGDEDVRTNVAAVKDAQQLEEFAKLLVECFRMKKSAVQVVASLAGAERAVERYFDAVQNKEALTKLRDNARRKYETASDDIR